MITLAVDVHYRSDFASAAGVVFNDWTASTPASVIKARIYDVQKYESGQFYKRELPCILQLLTKLDSLPECIVIDGHVYLDEHNKPGLGHHLYQKLNQNTVVIGVAKNSFKDMPIISEIHRGESAKPLYITAAGMDQEQAKNLIIDMHGKYRLPTLLREVDKICRGA